jgi:antitoxin (DNA-binding transcriptional repressor) of toxin-antitoxin stability system
MRIAGVREFRNNAPELLKGRDLVFVTRHGRLSSLLVPLASPEALPPELRKELIERIGEAVSGHLRRRGVSEARLKKDFKDWREDRKARRGRR